MAIGTTISIIFGASAIAGLLIWLLMLYFREEDEYKELHKGTNLLLLGIVPIKTVIGLTEKKQDSY